MSVQSLVNFGVPGQGGERSAVLQPILTNRFQVVFYNFGRPGEVAPYDLTRAVKSMKRPSYKFEEATVRSYLSTVYIATRGEFEGTSIKLSDDIDNTVSKRVQEQISKQQNFFDQTASRAGQNYKFEIDLNVTAGGASAGQSSNDPNIVQKFSFVGCWITGADLGEMSYDDAKPGEINIDIRFDNVTMFDHNGVMLGTFDHGPEIDSRLGDFITGVGGLL